MDSNSVLSEDENVGESNIAHFLVLICKISFVDAQQNFNNVYLK